MAASVPDSDLAGRLAARTLELVDIPSESHDEEAIRNHLVSLIPNTFPCVFAGDDADLFARDRRAGTPLVLLVGHYDTVPAQGNLPGRIANGAVHGLGSTDMKGGVAVAVEVVRDLAEAAPGSIDVALLLFGKEELPAQYNPLPEVFDGCSLVNEAALAILLEPTDLAVHAGCLGNMVARIHFAGVSGHAARPWQADNAIDRALLGLVPFVGQERREALVEGLPFYEVVSLTRLEAGVADNVIPDRATATLNFRYAPDRTPAEAARWLGERVPAGATLEIVGNSPPGLVVPDNPLVRRLREVGGLALEPKQAWTNVADFTARGIDAVNFGPGHTRYAHRRDELVEIASLVSCHETLYRFLTEPLDG